MVYHLGSFSERRMYQSFKFEMNDEIALFVRANLLVDVLTSKKECKSCSEFGENSLYIQLLDGHKILMIRDNGAMVLNAVFVDKNGMRKCDTVAAVVRIEVPAAGEPTEEVFLMFPCAHTTVDPHLAVIHEENHSLTSSKFEAWKNPGRYPVGEMALCPSRSVDAPYQLYVPHEGDAEDEQGMSGNRHAFWSPCSTSHNLEQWLCGSYFCWQELEYQRKKRPGKQMWCVFVRSFQQDVRCVCGASDLPMPIHVRVA